MKRTMTVTLITAILALLVFAFTGCDLDNRESISLAKTTFEGTIRGDMSVAKNFDWLKFRLQGNDYGPSYMTLTTEHEKSEFQSAIIMKMASYYKGKNWTTANVRNWKVDAKGVESSVVSAQVQGGGKIVVYMQKVNYEKKINRIEYE